MATQAIILPAVLVTALQKHYNAPKGGIYNYGPEYDGDGFKFAAWIEVNGNPPGDTHIYCRKVDVAGNEAGRWDFTLPAGWKPDDISKPTATLQPGHQRAHVVIGGSAHYNYLDPQGNPTARDTVPYECVIPDAWAPRPGAMGVEHDGPNGFIEQNTGGSGVTLDELTAALLDGNSTYHHAMKNAVKDFVNQTLTEAGVLTLPLTRAGGDAGYYLQEVNTAYTGALGALHAAGLYHAPQAMAIVEKAQKAHMDAIAATGEPSK